MIACIASGIAQMKRRHSSAQVPMSMSTSAALPAATSSAAVLSRVTPSTTGRSTIVIARSSPSSTGSRASTAACSPRRTRCTGTARSAAQSPGSTSSSSSTRVATRVAVSRPHVVAARSRLGDGALEEAVRAGVPMSVPTLMPPADSPKIVTLLGIAAERGDVVAHPLERGDLVEDAEVAGALRCRRKLVEVEEAERAEPVVDRHEHDAVARRTTCRRSTASTRCRPVNAPPWIHTITGSELVDRRRRRR